MKKVSGTLKLDQAQYRELEAFAKFGSDLDEATLSIINKGKRNVEILKQGLNSPLPVEEQIAIIYCGTKNLLSNVPINKIKEFESEFLSILKNKNSSELNDLKNGVLSEKAIIAIEHTAKNLTLKYT